MCKFRSVWTVGSKGVRVQGCEAGFRVCGDPGV